MLCRLEVRQRSGKSALLNGAGNASVPGDSWWWQPGNAGGFSQGGKLSLGVGLPEAKMGWHCLLTGLRNS